ncbi:type II toxin-antitoxin system RelE/ParE family toxin [Phytobacter sp. V91]|uniref:type II toxin-antitoxin system RelE/ParE family toxin n=1 Tax=Phytobacter sp. V91 TaxID=3369425 RepID=UPI003F61E456
MIAKDINWHGSSLNDLTAFPKDVRRDAGFQLDKIQHGREPADWKYINGCGVGTIEIRLHGDNGEFRVAYVAKFADAIHVLHCFHKKTQKIPMKDIAIIKARYKAAVDEGKIRNDAGY